MKKSLSILSAAILTASCLPLTVANAAEAPAFYMTAGESDKYELANGGKSISIDKLTEDVTATASIYFADAAKGAWRVSPKWKSNSDYIKITDVHNPLDEGNLKEFAYAEKDENGNLTDKNCAFDFSTNATYGTKNITVRSNDGMALVPYGEKSDSYPLITFDFTISKDTPNGTYELFFTTYEDNATRCAMDAINGNAVYTFPDNPPAISNLSINIGADSSSAISLQGKTAETAPGEKVEVNFVINAPDNTASGISGVFFKVNADEKLSFVSAKSADKFGFYGKYNTETGEVAFANPDGKNVSAANGDTLVTLTFEVPASAAMGDVFNIALEGLEIVDENGVNITSTAAIKPAEIKVTDTFTPNIGDINLDGSVDSSDASLALVEYASLSTGGTTTLNPQQAFNGNVNFDTSIDSSDASDILAYYAYLQTTSGDKKSFLEFFGREIPV